MAISMREEVEVTVGRKSFTSEGGAPHPLRLGRVTTAPTRYCHPMRMIPKTVATPEIAFTQNQQYVSQAYMLLDSTACSDYVDTVHAGNSTISTNPK